MKSTENGESFITLSRTTYITPEGLITLEYKERSSSASSLGVGCGVSTMHRIVTVDSNQYQVVTPDK